MKIHVLYLTLSCQLCSFLTSRVKLPLNESKINLLLSLGCICGYYPFIEEQGMFQSMINHYLSLGTLHT